MNRLGSSVLGELPILSIDEIVAQIDAVQAEDLHKLAGELFAGERLSVAGVGADEDLFREALTPLEAAVS
jgi:predicted Zn-dependent peptidase